MNIVLTEVNVPDGQLFELESINGEFRNADVVLVVGANDVVNPAARSDLKSPIQGMPILSVDEARKVFVIKRSLATGFAGIKNELFEKDNVSMLYGDAKEVLESLTKALKQG